MNSSKYHALLVVSNIVHGFSFSILNQRFHGWNSMTRLRNPRLLRINAAGCEKSRLQTCASLHFHRSKSWYRVNLTFVKGETLDQKRWLARPEKITWRIDRFTGVMVRDLVWYLADGIFVWSVEDGWGGERDCKVSTRVFTDLVAPLFLKSRRYEFLRIWNTWKPKSECICLQFSFCRVFARKCKWCFFFYLPSFYHWKVIKSSKDNCFKGIKIFVMRMKEEYLANLCEFLALKNGSRSTKVKFLFYYERFLFIESRPSESFLQLEEKVYTFDQFVSFVTKFTGTVIN